MDLRTLKRQKYERANYHCSLTIQRRFFPTFEAYKAISIKKKSELYFGLSAWASRRYNSIMDAWKSYVKIKQGERDLARSALSERQADLAKDVMRQWLILGLKRVEAREKQLVASMLPPPPMPRQNSWDPPVSRSHREKVKETMATPNLVFATDLTETTAREESQGSSRIRTCSARPLKDISHVNETSYSG